MSPEAENGNFRCKEIYKYSMMMRPDARNLCW